MSSRYLIGRFVPYFKPYLAILIFDLVCASFTTVSDIVLPLLIRYISNVVASDFASFTSGLIIRIAMIYVVLRGVDVVANYYMQNTGHVMGAKIETDMRRDLYEKCQSLSYSYYSENKTGQLISRITSDLFDITEFAHHCPEVVLDCRSQDCAWICITYQNRYYTYNFDVCNHSDYDCCNLRFSQEDAPCI